MQRGFIVGDVMEASALAVVVAKGPPGPARLVRVGRAPGTDWVVEVEATPEVLDALAAIVPAIREEVQRQQTLQAAPMPGDPAAVPDLIRYVDLFLKVEAIFRALPAQAAGETITVPKVKFEAAGHCYEWGPAPLKRTK